MAKATTTNRIRSEEANGLSSEMAAPPMETVVIEKILPKILEVEIVGMTPLLVCAWSEKARRQIIDKQMKKASKAKAAKDPEEDYKNSLYISKDGWTGIPAGGIKGCLVNACRAAGKELPMTIAKRVLFVHADGSTEKGQQLVRLNGEHQKHESMVRIDNGRTVDVRYRAIYPLPWSIKLQMEFLANLISMEQVVNLLELAGYCEGLCEHRPGAPKSCTGDFGRFSVKRAAE